MFGIHAQQFKYWWIVFFRHGMQPWHDKSNTTIIEAIAVKEYVNNSFALIE